MSSSEPSVYCPNPACDTPRNVLGDRVCANCQTPLIYRYLWAVGPTAAQIPVGELVGDRYSVIAPQIWLDTKPAHSPIFPQQLPDSIIPYLRLYPHRLHIPEVHGVWQLWSESDPAEIVLLENVPIDLNGALYPSIVEAWPEAEPVRLVYWLWQILQLWEPLCELGVASSLIKAENLRVQGWRVWLREVYPDSRSFAKLGLQDLRYCWLTWISNAPEPIAAQLKAVCLLMRSADADLEEVKRALNKVLLEQAAKLRLRVRVAGQTDPGRDRTNNEDTCYPTPAELQAKDNPPHNQLLPHLALVCDGVGGHEGGEVASQLAVQAIKLPIQAFLTEVAQQPEPASPKLVMEQLESILRVVNNTIAAQNDAQNRASRQRMGTTVMMALQLPQIVTTEAGEVLGNAHELYLLHVGDSRAYWITPNYCQRLTVDDDVATREVKLGRSLYREALQRRDAGALTQALGMRDGEFLHPTIQRFIVEEDGLLLLCSDGLSDNELVENSWVDSVPAIFNGEMSLEDGVERWIHLANEKNGHDNVSIVLAYCRISPEKLVLFETKTQTAIPATTVETEFSEASKALYDESVAPVVPEAEPEELEVPKKGWAGVLGIFLVLVMSGVIGFIGWSQIDAEGFRLLWQRFFPTSEPRVPPPPNEPPQ